MTQRRKKPSKPLPPPTASEAAFERLLASFSDSESVVDEWQSIAAFGIVPNETQEIENDALSDRSADGALNASRSPDGLTAGRVQEPVLQHEVGSPASPSAERSGDAQRLTARRVQEPSERSDDAKEQFIEKMFEKQKKFLERDPFAGIGDRDVFVTKIVGVSFEGRQDVVAGLDAGLELQLKREPDNPKDANAISVWYGNLQIGFLRKQIAKHVAPVMDAGVAYRVQIEHVTGGSDGKHRGVNIRVERENVREPAVQTVDVRADADRDTLRRALIGDAPLHEAQQQVLSRLERGKNTLAVMGTGRGKSFCFQYPAAYRALESSQKTLALYPLRALANDQFEALRRRLESFGLRILRANGAISPEERATLMAALEDGTWDIILATPEFLQFHREAFQNKSAPSLVVIDEVHHAFESKHRPAYGRLRETIAALGQPQVLGLTATARDDAFDHVVRELNVNAWVIDPTVRDNLNVADARGTRDKVTYLREAFVGDGKAIVYCNSRSEATKVAEALRHDFGNTVMFYHAGMPSAERAQVEAYFRAGDLRIVVATSAFGEGIDLPDVRHVVLYHLNFSFTEFNQQAGRAGRDGMPAQIHLLFGESDRRINEFIIDQESPTLATLRELYRAMRAMAAAGTLRISAADIARTIELDKANERTVAVALRIFEDEGLVEIGTDDDGRFARFLPASGRIDMTSNERFAEGEAERENFARFAEFVLGTKGETLERVINRPIYPQGQSLLR